MCEEVAMSSKDLFNLNDTIPEEDNQTSFLLYWCKLEWQRTRQDAKPVQQTWLSTMNFVFYKVIVKKKSPILCCVNSIFSLLVANLGPLIANFIMCDKKFKIHVFSAIKIANVLNFLSTYGIDIITNNL